MKAVTMMFATGVLAMISGTEFRFSQSKKATGQVVLEGSFDLDASPDMD